MKKLTLKRNELEGSKAKNRETAMNIKKLTKSGKMLICIR